MVEKKTKIEGFEKRNQVYCKLVKTNVDIEFCLSGGPMQAADACSYFIETGKNKRGEMILIHAVPTEEKVMQAIIKEKK